MARRFATRIGAIRANRTARIYSQKKKPIFIAFERFARIGSNLRFAIFQCPKARFATKGFGSGTLKRFAILGDSRESIRANIYAQIGPSKFLSSIHIRQNFRRVSSIPPVSARNKNTVFQNDRFDNPETVIFFSLPFWISFPFSFSRNSLPFCFFGGRFPKRQRRSGKVGSLR